jgi:hypothetical protein
MSDLIGSVFGVLLFILYGVGIYEIIVDDHRYTTKDVVIGAVFFPYPWYVGAKELYRFATTTSEFRASEAKCLDASETLGMPRNARLRYCECFAELQSPNACRAKILFK